MTPLFFPVLGQGVPKDADLALKWFRAAAGQENAEAEFFLGAMYLHPRKDIPQGLWKPTIVANRRNQRGT